MLPLDYGRSFINTNNTEINCPRFTIECRCRIKGSNLDEKWYYLISNMLSERLYKKNKLFSKKSSVFTAIFTDGKVIIYRTGKKSKRNIDVRKEKDAWGGMNLSLKKKEGTVIDGDNLHEKIQCV